MGNHPKLCVLVFHYCSKIPAAEYFIKKRISFGLVLDVRGFYPHGACISLALVRTLGGTRHHSGRKHWCESERSYVKIANQTKNPSDRPPKCHLLKGPPPLHITNLPTHELLGNSLAHYSNYSTAFLLTSTVYPEHLLGQYSRPLP